MSGFQIQPTAFTMKRRAARALKRHYTPGSRELLLELSQQFGHFGPVFEVVIFSEGLTLWPKDFFHVGAWIPSMGVYVERRREGISITRANPFVPRPVHSHGSVLVQISPKQLFKRIEIASLKPYDLAKNSCEGLMLDLFADGGRGPQILNAWQRALLAGLGVWFLATIFGASSRDAAKLGGVGAATAGLSPESCPVLQIIDRIKQAGADWSIAYKVA